MAVTSNSFEYNLTFIIRPLAAQCIFIFYSIYNLFFSYLLSSYAGMYAAFFNYTFRPWKYGVGQRQEAVALFV